MDIHGTTLVLDIIDDQSHGPYRRDGAGPWSPVYERDLCTPPSHKTLWFSWEGSTPPDPRKNRCMPAAPSEHRPGTGSLNLPHNQGGRGRHFFKALGTPWAPPGLSSALLGSPGLSWALVGSPGLS